MRGLPLAKLVRLGQKEGMQPPTDPHAVDSSFFTALVGADVAALEQILADDFILVDIMSGGEVDKRSLIAVIESGQLSFDRVDPIEARVRHYPGAAVINGRTEMSGRFENNAFSASSRYTHVYVQTDGRWRMVAAQGTRIA